MAAVRCPKCGTINYQGIGPSPRCRHCHEHLLKCRYCSHFDRRLLDCGHPLLREGSHISDPDLYAGCRQHATTLRVGSGGRALALIAKPPVLTALVLAVAIAAGGYAFAHYYQRSNEVAAPRLSMTASLHPTRAGVGQVVWIKVDIANHGRVPAEHVTLYVSRSFLANCEPMELSPPPQGTASDANWERLDFGTLGPGAGLTVRYTFEAKQSGTAPLHLQLRSARGMSHGAARFDLPVQDPEKRAPSGSPFEGPVAE